MNREIVNIVDKETSLKKHSHAIKITPKSKEPFFIPVIDVRDGDVERERARQMVKFSNHSKYTRPSFGSGGGSYQVSYKKPSA